jgi:hypothetical protein
VWHALATISPALREQKLAVGSERFDLTQPPDHRGHQWDVERHPGLRARGRKVPDSTQGRVAVEIELLPPGAQQLALADAEREQRQ